MAYPSTVTAFTNPLAGDKLNSPSHSSIETAQNTGLTEIQTFVGTTSSAVGTLMYDIRAAASDGGGHVQAANKGGTGQTSYTKGNLLVATSSSVLAKLAVGDDGQTIEADSSVAAGLKWSTARTNKVAVSASVVTNGVSSTSEQSIFSVSIPANTLGSSSGVRATAFVRQFQSNAGQASIWFRANYGTTTIASIVVTGNVAQTMSIMGTLEFTVLANAATNAQRGNFVLDLSPQRLQLNLNTQSVRGLYGFSTGTGAVDSTAAQNIGLTSLFDNSDALNLLEVNGYIIEKIV